MAKIIKGLEDSLQIFGCLANEKKLKLLVYVIREGGTLREIHNNKGEEIGLSHRETTHGYLEDLYELELIKKEKSDGIRYYSELNKLRFDLESF